MARGDAKNAANNVAKGFVVVHAADGDTASAEREQKLFQRFKTEEAAQSLTAKRRLFSPEDNNERQAIHDHESIDLKHVNSAPDTGESVRKAAPVKQALGKTSEQAGGGN
jgi:hypothetical protein